MTVTAALLAAWYRSANGTLMACSALRSFDPGEDWMCRRLLVYGFVRRADNENRTRTISLGMSAGTALISNAAGRQPCWLVHEYSRGAAESVNLNEAPLGGSY